MKDHSSELFHEAAEAMLRPVAERFTPSNVALYQTAITRGTACARQMVENLQILRVAWGTGSLGKAVGLSLVFSLSMISRLVWTVMSSSEASVRQHSSKKAISSILSCMHADDQGQLEKHAYKLDDQFWYAYEDPLGPYQQSRIRGVDQFMGEHVSQERVLFVLLLDLALHVCGHALAIDWDKSRIPCASDADLLWKGNRIGHPDDCFTWSAIDARCLKSAVERFASSLQDLR